MVASVSVSASALEKNLLFCNLISGLIFFLTRGITSVLQFILEQNPFRIEYIYFLLCLLTSHPRILSVTALREKSIWLDLSDHFFFFFTCMSFCNNYLWIKCPLTLGSSGSGQRQPFRWAVGLTCLVRVRCLEARPFQRAKTASTSQLVAFWSWSTAEERVASSDVTCIQIQYLEM